MAEDFLPIIDWDHIEFYVSNAKQAAFYYSQAFGMEIVAYAGLETGVLDHTSYLLQSGDIRFVLTSPLHSSSPIAEWVCKHGDGVRDIALTVPDATSAYEETTKRGAVGVLEPVTIKDKSGHGIIKRSAIKTYGDVVHSFIERKGYNGPFLPGFVEQVYQAGPRPAHAGLMRIDHAVGNVELGKMNYWVEFYEDVMGFKLSDHFDDEHIKTEYAALMSKVMQNGNGYVKFPINEPAYGKNKKKSQIDEYLYYNEGPGVQHIAMRTDDIVASVSQLMAQGVQFLPRPVRYYTDLEDRLRDLTARGYGTLGPSGHPIKGENYLDKIPNLDRLAQLGILVDGDDEGYLLQIFTRIAQDRPSLFFEVIQRRGARGFGTGTFKALFEALEREKDARALPKELDGTVDETA
ncbi:MAG: 4-hydroxyphenylpyruvate dioxygenase [Ktedonobacterales bacterium]